MFEQCETIVLTGSHCPTLPYPHWQCPRSRCLSCIEHLPQKCHKTQGRRCVARSSQVSQLTCTAHCAPATEPTLHAQLTLVMLEISRRKHLCTDYKVRLSICLAWSWHQCASNPSMYHPIWPISSNLSSPSPLRGSISTSAYEELHTSSSVIGIHSLSAIQQTPSWNQPQTWPLHNQPHI